MIDPEEVRPLTIGPPELGPRARTAERKKKRRKRTRKRRRKKRSTRRRRKAKRGELSCSPLLCQHSSKRIIYSSSTVMSYE